jgi:acetyltransferase
MTVRNLDRLFAPKSIAVIGASREPGTLGGIVFQTAAQSGFQGPVYAVNPKGGTLHGRAVYASVAELPAPPDLAVIVTPAPTVSSIVSELGGRGCKAAVILSAGFGEGGERLGRGYRDDVLAAARPHLLRIVGPNCLGVMVPGVGLNASFARTPPARGGLALVAQSGAIAAALLDWACPRGLGFSHVITVGDMIDVDFGDLLDYLSSDETTHAILLYVEGLTSPRKFISAARRAARLKPVVAIKGGRQAATAKAAASHTGALAGSDAIYDAVFKRAGILRVDDLDDLFAGAELLAADAPVAGDRLAIVTNGGGLGVLAADQLLVRQGRLAELSPEMLAKLNEGLPATWSHANPIDIIGDATAERYRAAVQGALDDSENDAVLVLHCPTSATDPSDAARAVIGCRRQSHKPLLTAWTGEASVADARRAFVQARLPTFETPAQAVNAFMQLVRFQRLQALLLEVPPPAEGVSAQAVQDVRAILSQIDTEKWLRADVARQILNLYAIPTNRAAITRTPTDAQCVAQRWGCRVALKVSSPDIVHKSDVGGVVLDVDPASVAEEAARMLSAVLGRVPQARIDGVLVEEMVARPRAHELFIGVTTDLVFGPVLAFGHGGTGIEVIDDKAFGLPPLNLNLATAMIGDTRVGQLLAGYRDRPPAASDAIARALVNLSQLVADHPQIADIDINPVLVDEHGLVAVDVRIKIKPDASDSTISICPYPRHLERVITRTGGKPFHVRALRPEDTPLVEAFMRKLTPQDLRFRFFSSMKGLDHRSAVRLCQLDYDREIALVATTDSEGKDVTAIVHLHADPDNTEAEFALMVRSDLQDQGIGFSLMTYIKEVAQARGIGRLWGLTLADNVKMRSLAKALNMQCKGSTDNGTFRLVWDLAEPVRRPKT